MQQTSAKNEGGARGGIEAFDYPACPGAPPVEEWNGWEEVSESGAAHGTAHDGVKSVPAHAANRDFEERLAQETLKSFETGRERGRQEGRQAERDAQAAALAAEAEQRKRQLAGLMEGFSREHDRFLHAVEGEVVKLALAVAARILRREAQMDPLLLSGAVRVALGQLAGASEVRLRVPAAEADLWKETIALAPNLTIKPIVVPAEGMRCGDCVIESKVGTVDLGVRSQLAEIERGFFDRPEPVAAAETNADSREAVTAGNVARAGAQA